MPHRPRKPTTSKRERVVQEIRVIVLPELDAPPGSWREVQILVPTGSPVFVGLDVTPEDLGLNRNYKLGEYPPGAMIKFALLPEQFVVAAAGTNTTVLTVIAQFFGGE